VGSEMCIRDSSKSFDWLNQRLAMFFVELNLKG
jgi:hypothetical protein